MCGLIPFVKHYLNFKVWQVECRPEEWAEVRYGGDFPPRLDLLHRNSTSLGHFFTPKKRFEFSISHIRCRSLTKQVSSVLPCPLSCFLSAIWLSLTEQQNLLSCHRDPAHLLHAICFNHDFTTRRTDGAGAYHSPRTHGGGRAPKQSIREWNLTVFLFYTHSDMISARSENITRSRMNGNAGKARKRELVECSSILLRAQLAQPHLKGNARAVWTF